MSYELTGLSGKTVVVTGAGRMRSIGRSVALEFARAGCNVVITGTGRNPETFPPEERAAGWRDIESVAAEVATFGVQALPVVMDVSNPSDVERLKKQTLAEFERVDIVVNNAAASRGEDRVSLLELADADWAKVMNVNLTGSFLMTRSFARHWVENGLPGNIVNISSIGGKIGGPSTGAYAASKAGVQSLTSSSAKEFGKLGIRVNAVCPGVTATSRLSDWDDEQWDAYIRTNIPLQRMGEPQEIAHAVVFLASDQAAWVTGQCWNVDGGQLTIR